MVSSSSFRSAGQVGAWGLTDARGDESPGDGLPDERCRRGRRMMMREPDHCTAPRAEHGSVPRPLLAVVLLSAIAVLCASLGVWQLGRAGESRAAVQRFEAALDLPAFTLETADEPDDGLRYRKVTTTGRYVPERQVLIDHIVHDGVVGYLVLTPFAPDDGGPWLIVNR